MSIGLRRSMQAGWNARTSDDEPGGAWQEGRYTICMDTQIDDPTTAQVAWASETFKLLADPTRLRIVWTLLHGEHSVNSLAGHVGAQPSAVSQHLAKLHLAHVVEEATAGDLLLLLDPERTPRATGNRGVVQRRPRGGRASGRRSAPRGG